MQEMQSPIPNAFPLKEYFADYSDRAVNAKMDRRRKELEAKGYTFVRRIKIGRNEPCPCGSGRKFKKCHIHNVEALNTPESPAQAGSYAPEAKVEGR